MSITEKSGLEQLRRNWTSRLRARRIDKLNRNLYGTEAPRFAECLCVPLSSMKFAVKAGSSKHSARVINHWPTDGMGLIEQTTAIKACLAHWRDGIPWERTGIYDTMLEQIRLHGKVDRLRTIAEVKTRYEQLDALYDRVQATGRLSTRQELIPGNYREEGGILINIGPAGTPYFGRKGNHRLAMAIAAGLDCIPAQLGVVHIEGLPFLPQYRTGELRE